MNDKRACTRPGALIRRFHTRDPFVIAEGLGITVLKRYDFKHLKGAFQVVLNQSFLIINGNLSEQLQRIVCAHELGHALLHKRLCGSQGHMLEFELFDIKNQLEYDANLFAANLLLDEEDLLSLSKQEYDIVSIARMMNSNVNLVLLKLAEMKKQDECIPLRMPELPKRNFLGTINDNATGQ